LPSQYAVFRAAIGDLYRRHSFSPPEPPEDAFLAQQGHLLEHDAGRCFLAEESGRVVAYTAAFLRDETWFLSSLFVLPEYQGRGLGSSLLERVWHAEAKRRLTLTDAIQPVSNTMYAGRGLIPATPMLSLEGPARAEPPRRLQAVAPEPAALALLDRAAYGFDRAREHALWGAAAEVTLWLRDEEPVAYSYVWPPGAVGPRRIGPVAGRDAASAAAGLQAELARRAGGQTLVVVPGSSVALVEVALAAGLRISGPPGLLLLSSPARPPDSLAIGSYTLF
jgi:GNAT superfamily N-acetyltransferase